MILLWTTSDKIGSRLIRYGLDEPMSHFAIAFFATKKKGLLLHQDFRGFRVQWLPEFLKENRIVYSMRPNDLDRTSKRILLHATMNEFSGTNYDGGSFFYFAWRAALKKFLGIPFPKTSKWGKAKEPVGCVGISKYFLARLPS